jgi:hypothetical protein
MGAAALPFADDLFSLLDASDDEDGRFFNGVKILGVLAQTDKRIAQEVVARLNSGRPTIRHAAVSALDRSGDELALPLDPVVTSLRRLADDAETRLPALAALASVGRGRADVVEQVLAAARPRPPRWRHYPDHSEYRYDEVMFERGTAIRSARHLTAFAERVVPMLVDALDTFEEYDPDWDYHLGDHGRTLASLRAFGPAARTAVPGLLKHLRNPDGTLDLEVLNVLGEMGPAAAESLPALRRLHAEENPDTPVPENPEDLDKDGDRLSWAIWMIGDVGNAK